MITQDLGIATAYGYAKSKGYTGTEAEFAELMAGYAEVGQTAVDAAETATTKANEASASASTAQTAANTTTTKAGEASQSASTAQTASQTATTKASEASTSAQTATTKASEATTKASEASQSASDALAAKTAAETAQGNAESAKTDAESAKADAEQAKADAQDIVADINAKSEQIDQNAEDISDLQTAISTKAEIDGNYENLTAGTAEQILSDKGVTDSVPYHYRKTGGDGADRLYDQIVGGTVCFNQLCNDASVIVQSGRKYLSKIGAAWAVGTSTGTAITGLTSGADMIIDLTAMFGSTIADYIYSLETAHAGDGVAFFKALFPNDYYPYNAGELVSVSGLSEHKMVGFNQWDEEWEVGYIVPSTGALNNRTDRIMSKKYIPVLGGIGYYFHTLGMTMNCVWYDASLNYIRNNSPNNEIIISPQNARYCKFSMPSDYGAIYNHDICINLSDPTKNGTYEPYKTHSYPLDSTLTLRGVPKLVDGKMCFDGDTYDADGTVTRRYGVVDLGMLDWKASSTANCFYATAPLYKMVNNMNHICERYKADGFGNGGRGYYGEDGTIRYNYESIQTACEFYVHDSSYTDATAFKTAMSGVMLVYELATPTTEEADPYQHLQQCDPNGTEEYVSTGIVPVGHNSFYPENLRAKVEGLPWNFASIIAPTESAFVATRNYVTGDLFIVSNVLYKATSNIANGGTITPNTNCTATTLAEIISALA